MEKPSLLPVLTTSPSTSQLPEWHTVFFFLLLFFEEYCNGYLRYNGEYSSMWLCDDYTGGT